MEDTHTHKGEIDMTTNTGLVRGSFEVEGCAETFEGYWNPDDRWNGFAKPEFTWDVACEIAKHNLNEGAIDAESRRIVEDSAWYPEDPPIAHTALDTITTDGVLPLYAIGTGYWVWMEN
jgi:hypothetical protein